MNSLPIYRLSFYKTLTKLLKEIRSIHSKFLWRGLEDKRAIHWVSWEQVCKYKECEGLGIKNLEAFNKALLLKWKWRIVIDISAIWRGLIMHMYNNPEVKMFIIDKSAINNGDLIWWKDLIMKDIVEDGKSNFFSNNMFCMVKD